MAIQKASSTEPSPSPVVALRSAARCPAKSVELEDEGRVRGRWVARVPAEHKLEDVLSPRYFEHCCAGAKALRVSDTIEVEPECGSWWFSARVMAVSAKLGQVTLRLHAEPQDYSETPPDGYAFKWLGDVGRWAILRGDTVIDNGFTTQTEALLRVEELMRDRAI